MKKVLASTALVGLLIIPLIALAQGEGDLPIAAPEWGEIDIIELLDNITRWLFGILMIIAAIAIIVAAYFFVTAAGDPDKTKKARDFVLYALIGVVVAFAARGLIYLVNRIVG